MRNPTTFEGVLPTSPESENQSKTQPTDTSETALRVFHRITCIGELDDSEVSELLGSPGNTAEGKSEVAMERVSLVLGIYKNLRIIFPTEQQAHEWVRKPNKAFGGRSAIDVMIDDPSSVRRYLDSQLV